MISDYLDRLEKLGLYWRTHEEVMTIILKILEDIRDQPELLDKYIDAVRWS